MNYHCKQLLLGICIYYRKESRNQYWYRLEMIQVDANNKKFSIRISSTNNNTSGDIRFLKYKMENRRDFIKKAGILAGTFGVFGSLPKAIQAAIQIDPAIGSTYLDAEHIVLLMQENRSFDHSFGTLRGVRGFDDPRAMILPNGNPVWLQSDKNGDTYAPFRLDIKNSHAAWTRDLPHSWENQIGAWNKGNFDNWLESKRSGNKKYRDLPLTLGYYTREDIPFYYAFADAFTICDQHFCSSITGTTTNRHFFWTGKCVPEKGAKPLVRNSDVYFNKMVKWHTFPERLQQQHISWKVYQNEISLQNDLADDAESWLGNFTDNNLEWFEQYKVRYKKSHIDFYKKRLNELPHEISGLEERLAKASDPKLTQTLLQKKNQLDSFRAEYDQYKEEKFAELDTYSKSLHERAFQTNEGDPEYHNTTEIAYEGATLTVPKGDILHQFRQDVQNETLPTVSWLCAPQNFSDHPSAPMYGAWYVSEVLRILTENPAIWKKTIFILNYDENDGYYDHIPPFVAPKPGDNTRGNTSSDLDCSTEYVTREQELEAGVEEKHATEGPVGLGYRVPLIIASPWSKGGWVNSEVCDITSTIQFLEHFIDQKYGKDVKEDNISSWRRAITGDLSSVFRPFQQEDQNLPAFVDRDRQIAQINAAKDKPIPNNFKLLTDKDIDAIRDGNGRKHLPAQEKGTKPANALAYELYVQESYSKKTLSLKFESSTNFFKRKSLGAAFNVYAYGHKREAPNWSFAASAGNSVTHDWDLTDFENDNYHLAVHGPNGFYRLYQGKMEDSLHVEQLYDMASESIVLVIHNKSTDAITLDLTNFYQKNKSQKIRIKAKSTHTVNVSAKNDYRWYDLQLSNADPNRYSRRYAGRIENGQPNRTDPMIGIQ